MGAEVGSGSRSWWWEQELAAEAGVGGRAGIGSGSRSWLWAQEWWRGQELVEGTGVGSGSRSWWWEQELADASLDLLGTSLTDAYTTLEEQHCN